MISIKCLIVLCYLGVCLSAQLNYNVHFFYYPWYGAPPTSKSWVHWNGGAPGVLDHKPENGDITSNYFPVLGPYDSCDPKVLTKHMQWISETGVGTIISSWWGKGGFEDHCITKIMDLAHIHQIQVAFHIEPYGGRTANSVVNDIKYINEHYGSHPAYFRDPKFGNRDAFYIFDSLEIKEWSPIEALKKDHIILAQTTDQSIEHFSGFYNYAVGDDHNIVGIWKSMNDFCKTKGQVWSPSIGPGYIDKRAVPNSHAINLDRKNGQTYDDNWKFVLDSGIPHWVSITSFNEWHEGSMIEPASSKPPKGFSYLSYSGAYNKSGTASETAYLERTAFWVKEFTKRSQ